MENLENNNNNEMDNNELGLHVIKEAFNKEINITNTKLFVGAVRSGTKLEYEGSVAVIGDVNAGAEVLAGENILIIGALRGVAHAGAKGNAKAIIAAGCIEAPQIRISNLLLELDINTLKYEELKTIAKVENDKIILE